MREILEAATTGFPIYAARREEYDTGQHLPFRISDHPFYLSEGQEKDIDNIGRDIVAYFQAVTELYQTNQEAHELLDRGKPSTLFASKRANYLFVRPDMIITEDGFAVCELETSPFGLALADVLNRGYRSTGFKTLVGEKALETYLKSVTPPQGTIIYSEKTKAYAGQMQYMAAILLSSDNRRWAAKQLSGTGLDPFTENADAFYRGFYLSEAMSDPNVEKLLGVIDKENRQVIPSLTPHAEEKALLSFIWDKRFEKLLKIELGVSAFDHLRCLIPPTWIVGQERYFVPGLPNQYTASSDLAKLTKRQRAFVLKSSGFSPDASWAEGVYFLGKKNAMEDAVRLRKAEENTAGLYVIQAMRRGKKHTMFYSVDGRQVPMQARVRLTPYFSAQPENAGELVAVKATACENTDYIHASSASINTAVAVCS